MGLGGRYTASPRLPLEPAGPSASLTVKTRPCTTRSAPWASGVLPFRTVVAWLVMLPYLNTSRGQVIIACWRPNNPQTIKTTSLGTCSPGHLSIQVTAEAPLFLPLEQTTDWPFPTCLAMSPVPFLLPINMYSGLCCVVFGSAAPMLPTLVRTATESETAGGTWLSTYYKLPGDSKFQNHRSCILPKSPR